MRSWTMTRALALATCSVMSLSAHAAVTPVRLATGFVATSLWDTDPTHVGVAVQLSNRGTGPAENVQVASIAVQGGALATALPIALGTIGEHQDAVFNLTAVIPTVGTRALLTITGTYGSGGRTYGFSVNRAITSDRAPSQPVTAHSGVATVQRPNTAFYPPAPQPPVFGPNAETPMLIPPGPSRLLFAPTPTGTGLATPGAAIEIPINTTNRNGAGVPPDPSAATAAVGGVALATYNTGIEVSTNGGGAFTDHSLTTPIVGNPARTTFFPQSDGGLCCDQVMIYLPQQDLFVWLLQYNPITACTTNCTPAPGTTPTSRITQSSRLRIAYAKPAQVAADFDNAWTYIDLTATAVPGVSDGLGVPNNEWLDYPDLAFSGQFLYVGVDHGSPMPGQVYNGRRIVARVSLADMANTAATSVSYQWAELTGSNGLNKTHFVQNAPGRMVVGGLDNSSTLRVFTWDDGSDVIPAANTVPISTIQTGTAYTSAAPDGSDWVGVSFPGNITSGTYRKLAQFAAPPIEEYMFAFDAGVRTPDRPRSYVRLESLSPTGTSTYSQLAEYDIWNPDYAYAMAALGSGTNATTPEIGLSLAVGGGTLGYPQGVVGFKDDFVVYQVTSSDSSQKSRFGDYFDARLVPGTENRFATQTYEVIGGTAQMRYVEFQRPRPIINPPH